MESRGKRIQKNEKRAPKGRPSRKGINRERILKAASVVFRRKGYSATTMNDIAKALHLQKPGLYHYVKSKQEVLDGILEMGMEKVLKDVQRICDSELRPPEKLRAAMEAHVTNLIMTFDEAAVFLNDLRFLKSRNRRKGFYLIQKRYERMFQRIINEGVEEGVFQCADVKLTSFAFLGMGNWVVRWYKPGGRESSESIGKWFGELCSRSLLVR